MNKVVNEALRRASKKPPRIESCDFFLLIGRSNYQNANTKGVEKYRSETFRVDAHEFGAQPSDGAFFRKKTWFRDIFFESEGQVTKI